MQLSVILVSFNSLNVLKPCLGFLKKRLEENFESDQAEIIVVDNNSQDKTPAWLAKEKDVKTIWSKKIWGLAGDAQVGI